uniref:TPR_REGION domain-containing protein n=1 Tax=Mesocestoides corti TaxID=53468 RepID=A0A5K3EGX2_MESCO
MNLLDLKESVTCAEMSREAFVIEKSSGNSTYDTQFSYALDLLKTKDKSALTTAEFLLKDCFLRADDSKKRECIFLIAIANTKMGHYEQAIECCNNLLNVNPNDHQSHDLKVEIERRRRREGIVGASLIASGVVVAVAGVAAALALLLRRS